MRWGRGGRVSSRVSSETWSARTKRRRPASKAAKRLGPRAPRPDDPNLDRVWRALADPTRRRILDLLRTKPLTTTLLVERIPGMSRFGVMKHLAVLREAGLVQSRDQGRSVVNRLNVIPIRLIYERWVSEYQDLWARRLTGLKRALEKEGSSHRGDE